MSGLEFTNCIGNESKFSQYYTFNNDINLTNELNKFKIITIYCHKNISKRNSFKNLFIHIHILIPIFTLT